MLQKYLFIKYDKKCVRLPYGDIQYIVSMKKYVKIVTVKQVYLLLLSISEVEKKLPTDQFCRIHRSHIISLDHTTEFDHEIVKVANKELPIGRQYRNVLLRLVDILGSNIKFPDKLTANDLKVLMKEIKPN